MMTFSPVRQSAGRRHFVGARELQQTERTQDCVEDPARRHRIGQRKLDLLVVADDEDGADGVNR